MRRRVAGSTQSWRATDVRRWCSSAGRRVSWRCCVGGSAATGSSSAGGSGPLAAPSKRARGRTPHPARQDAARRLAAHCSWSGLPLSLGGSGAIAPRPARTLARSLRARSAEIEWPRTAAKSAAPALPSSRAPRRRGHARSLVSRGIHDHWPLGALPSRSSQLRLGGLAVARRSAVRHEWSSQSPRLGECVDRDGRSITGCPRHC